MISPALRVACCAMVLLCLPTSARAQRTLHWESVEVDATLDATGTLHVAETQTMVFTGAWNGGERTFDIRPRQKLSLVGMSRWHPDGWRALTEDGALDDVDDYAWSDGETLRWRSRDADDPAFENTSIRYLLRYAMSGILLKPDTGYVLNHDFLFPEREGRVNRFELRLTLDPVWRSTTSQPEKYTAENLDPGQGFVVTLPLQFSGTSVPLAVEPHRPYGVNLAIGFLLLALGLGLAVVFLREERVGRFAPLATDIDETWLQTHVLKYPAEVVGAVWDENISTPEVVALIARMVSEGKLASTVNKGGTMTLDLKAARETLDGHERTLVDRLFFGGRTQTSTKQVRQHYRSKGFNPAREIRGELEAAVEAVMPDGPAPPRLRTLIQGLFIAGIALLGIDFYVVRIQLWHPLVITLGSALLLGVSWGLGTAFRAHIHWSYRAAWLCLIPTLVMFAAAAAFLRYKVSPGDIEASVYLVVAVVALALAVLLTSIDAMLSRQQRSAVAFRKRLAAARAFFHQELAKDAPGLRDEWLPWILAFGLANRMDDWSARQSTSGSSRHSSTTSFSPGGSSGGGSTSLPGWTGFSGGRSGGAGASAAWVNAASGMAASVSTPTSNSSSSGGGSSSSSSSSSSGGGGGGGW
jgi:hypothetical protein